MKYLNSLILIFLVFTGVQAQQASLKHQAGPFRQSRIVPAASLIPLRKGLSWVYEGKIEWQKGNQIEKKNIRLMMEVVKVIDNAKARVAVVRGFPAGLAWYDEKPAGYSLLIAGKRNIYYLEAEDRQEAFELAREFSRNFDMNLPLARPILFKQLLKLPDSKLTIKGLDSRRKLQFYQSVHQTNPDIEKIDFARGLGITRYYYNHFGSDALADVELKEVRFPGKMHPRRLKTSGK